MSDDDHVLVDRAAYARYVASVAAVAAERDDLMVARAEAIALAKDMSEQLRARDATIAQLTTERDAAVQALRKAQTIRQGKPHRTIELERDERGEVRFAHVFEP